MEHHAYISIDTGTIYWISEADPLEEEIPEDLETSDRYIAIPHKNDLDLGSDLALRFAAEELPGLYNRVEEFFRHRGAYARFKELLASKGCLDKWYAFEAKCTERALRSWWVDWSMRPTGTDVEGVPVSALNRNWRHASVIRLSDLPAASRQQGERPEDNGAVFAVDIDLDGDSHDERAVVGVYETAQGKIG